MNRVAELVSAEFTLLQVIHQRADFSRNFSCLRLHFIKFLLRDVGLFQRGVKVVLNLADRTFRLAEKWTNSRLPLRSNPSAMFAVAEMAARRIGSRRTKSLENSPRWVTRYTVCFNSRAFCRDSMSSNFVIVAITAVGPTPKLETSNPKRPFISDP
jgi:hypothetical protein